LTLIWGILEILCNGVYPVGVGFGLGFLQSFMVNELPNVANIDLLKAPEFLT
jgi:hypothetical protein